MTKQSLQMNQKIKILIFILVAHMSCEKNFLRAFVRSPAMILKVKWKVKLIQHFAGEVKEERKNPSGDFSFLNENVPFYSVFPLDEGVLAVTQTKLCHCEFFFFCERKHWWTSFVVHKIRTFNICFLFRIFSCAATLHVFCLFVTSFHIETTNSQGHDTW